MNTIRVLYFAAIRDLVGKPEEEIELPPSVTRIADLVAHLETVRPALRGRLGAVRIAVNEEFVQSNDEIRPSDVVALIPPVAGG